MAETSQPRSSQKVVRTPDFEIDLTTTEGMLRYARFYLNVAANIAGMCMTDHLGDEALVRDMHDVIGALGALNDTLHLIENRTKTVGTSGGQDDTATKGT